MSTPRAMKQLAKGLRKLKSSGMTSPATLIKFTAGVRTIGAASAGTNPVPTEYKCHVAPGTATTDKIGGTLIEKNDRIYVMPGKLIAGGQRPSTSDQLRIDSDTLRIVGFDDVGAGAAFIVLARK